MSSKDSLHSCPFHSEINIEIVASSCIVVVATIIGFINFTQFFSFYYDNCFRDVFYGDFYLIFRVTSIIEQSKQF